LFFSKASAACDFTPPKHPSEFSAYTTNIFFGCGFSCHFTTTQILKTMVEKAMTRATGIGPLPEILEAYAGSKLIRTVFADASLPQGVIHDRAHLIPLFSLARLYQAAAERTGDHAFGLAAGLEMSPGDYGKWVLYASQAPTLADGISRAIDTLHLHQTGSVMRLAPRKNGQVAWEYWHAGTSIQLFTQHSDHVVPGLIRFVQIFLGQDWRPAWVEVGYPSPNQAGHLEAATEAAWVFDRPSMAIVMSCEELRARRPQLARQPQKTPLLTFRDIVAESEPEWSDTSLKKIASVISLRLLDGNSDIEGAAQALGTGIRKLQRCLEDQGLTYRSLLTHIRMQRAKSLIEETDIPLKSLFSELGYSDPAHFTRAFRKHCGYPPSQFQKKVSIGRK
jgi:AraC-like DNA-binding protein